MPIATQTIQKVRDPSYYFKPQKKKHHRSKPSPWVDVSDDEGSRKTKKHSHQRPHPHPHANPLKRKNSLVNGHADHESPRNGINGPGPKHKKRRHSASASMNGTDSPPPADSHSHDMTNGTGPQPGSSKKPHLNGAGPASAKAKAIQEQRAQLPIAKGKEALIEEIRKNEVTILLGETGSGKTTQIPQYILESNLFPTGLIGITQPRRVAATSLATRVALEQRTPLGTLVGYSVRFDEASSASTRIKYMTDGMIVRELMSDPLLSAYSVVVVDEAHERTLRTDLLVANLKRILRERNRPPGAGGGGEKGKGKADADGDAAPTNPLKVVIMSATLDAEKFSKFFHNAKIIYIKGRQHPVKIYHAAQPQLDYTDAAMRTFFQIHTDQPPGDVLIFLPGQEDIESFQKSIELYAKQLPEGVPAVQTQTMYAAQDPHTTSKAFLPTPPHTRKCILATNIAETSITIPGIKYVIDTGKCKEKQYLARVSGGGFDTLLTRDVTKSSALQRAGRAGREGPGICFRLYTEDAFNAMKPSADPEILRCSLTASILNLKALGQDLAELELMDKPDMESIASALKTLWLLGAIDNHQHLTPTGRLMSLFPLDPQHACILIASKTHGCTAQILDIISLLSASSKVFLSPSPSSSSTSTDNRTSSAAEARLKFRHASGDHLTLLSAYRSYLSLSSSPSSTSNSSTKAARREWCRTHLLNERAFLEAREIRKQLLGVCERAGIDPNLAAKEGQEEEDRVIRALGHGLAGNSAFLQPDGSYKQTMGQTIIKIHPSSTLADKKVPAIIYDELVYTNQIYARGVSAIPKSFFMSLDAFKQRKA